ncbi:TIGR04211 family SH3 domain-containing protein [Candidatus Methylocalor cossyra]|uniref:SH3 domain protein n=1 Tax=Candidatus Methylocalor cossyra TaxID=3108543 RepID=A0ABM9NGX7_9GAMM
MANTFILLILLCLPLALPAAPRKAYITDQAEIPLRSGQSTQHRILKPLTAGLPVTVLSDSTDTGYSLVKLESGEQGWVLSRYLSAEPTARSRLDEVEAKLQAALAENKRLQEELAALKRGKDDTDKTAQQQRGEIERLNTELIAIRQASANVLQIQAERDRLQESVIQLERELETLRREKSALDGDYRQNWFLIGAGVLFGGVLLGLILPRLSWRRRTSWSSF